MATGRPSRFNDALLEKITALYADGKTDAEVAKAIGVSLKTIYNWKGKHPQFLHALKDSKGIADDLVEASLFQRATGYTCAEEKIFVYEGMPIRVKTVKHYAPDVTAQIFWLKNRRADLWRESTGQPIEQTPVISAAANFSEFCVRGAYPKPYPKQIEMKEFGIQGIDAQNPKGKLDVRMILGARGYGKTDYTVCCGIAEELKRNPAFRVLIITKSEERNASMLKEISNIAKANGVVFEKENSSSLRIQGLVGKDHSVSAVTIKTVTLRGRHPDLVIMDDPVTEDDTSDATRTQVEKKWNEINKLVSNILVIGQPAHKHDLYAKILSAGGARVMTVPHGTIPELDHDLEAQRLAGVDEASISASYHLKILSEGTIPFDKIRYIDEYPQGGTSVAWIDPSNKGKDHTAMTILKQYGQGLAVVGFTYKKAWNHCLDEMVPLLHKYGVKRVAFEVNNLGDLPVEMLSKLLSGSGVGVTGRESTLNKHAKIMACASFAHLIHLSKQSSKSYTDQVIKYEYGAEPDDAPDSLASCLEWIGLSRGKT